MAGKRNPPVLVWSISFLWLISLLAIAWSLLLYFCFGNMLLITKTDVINAFILLSGFTMLPANVILMCAVANGQLIDWNYKILSCPLWVFGIVIITINAIGALLCVIRIHTIHSLVENLIHVSLKEYKHVPRHKHFIDNLQWSLKCCGLNSYKDWFNYDWYDKSQSVEWQPIGTKSVKRESMQEDGVPLSCCKSGSCMSNYLSELGTSSINTRGCLQITNKLILWILLGHLIIFLLTIGFEIMILVEIRTNKHKGRTSDNDKFHVRHIMSVNEKFDEASSDSFERDNSQEDSDMEVLQQ